MRQWTYLFFGLVFRINICKLDVSGTISGGIFLRVTSSHRQIVVGHRRHRCHVWLHALQIIIIGFLTCALLVRALFVLTIINHTCWTEFVRAFHLQLALQFRILSCWMSQWSRGVSVPPACPALLPRPP